MTGRHIGHARTEGQGQQLRPEERTIAKMLKAKGYATAMIGKWGLGGQTGRPDLQGFDFWYGFLDQRRAHFHYPEWLWRDGEKELLPDNPEKHSQHTQDLFTREALKFMRAHRDQPRIERVEQRYPPGMEPFSPVEKRRLAERHRYQPFEEIGRAPAGGRRRAHRVTLNAAVRGWQDTQEFDHLRRRDE